MSGRKTEFWWASIHGADPEPVEKTEHEGRPCVYTLGCGDPFYLDETPCAVMFLPKRPYDNSHLQMVRPRHPDNSLAEQAAKAAIHAATPKHKRVEGGYIGSVGGGRHSWRGPR